MSHSNSVLVSTGITSHGWLLIPIMTKSVMVMSHTRSVLVTFNFLWEQVYPLLQLKDHNAENIMLMLINLNVSSTDLSFMISRRRYLSFHICLSGHGWIIVMQSLHLNRFQHFRFIVNSMLIGNTNERQL